MRGKEIISPTSKSIILDQFIEINVRAGQIIRLWRAGQKNLHTKINVNGSRDIVTEADTAIEDLTSNLFKGLAPVFGEENFKNDSSLTNEPLYIVVDPIDGTKEFARGSSEWSISLCAVEGGVPIIASIFMPDRNEMFTAVRGQGVNLNGVPLNIVGEMNNRIAVSPRQITIPEFSQHIASSGLIPSEISALTPKICALLRGEVEVATYFPQFGQSAALWDYAASVLLVHEVGGRMTSLCGKELPFSGSEIIHKNGWLATKRSERHNELLACLGKSVHL